MTDKKIRMSFLALTDFLSVLPERQVSIRQLLDLASFLSSRICAVLSLRIIYGGVILKLEIQRTRQILDRDIFVEI